MRHVPTGGVASGDLRGVFPFPRINGGAYQPQIADDIFQGRFPANYTPPYVQGGIVKQVAGWGAGTSAIVAPTNLVAVPIFITCTLREVLMLGTCGAAGGVGSCSVDIWKTSSGALGTVTSATSICGGTIPAIAGGNVYDNSALTGWTKNFNKGDILVFSLNSSTTFTALGIWLRTG